MSNYSPVESETDSIMWFVVAVMAALLFGFGGFLFKFSTMRTENTVSYLLMGLYLTATPLFVVTAILTDTLQISGWLVFAGILVGIGSFLGNFCYVRAMRMGPVSLTGPLANSNIVLVILMSVLLYHEAIEVKDVIGVILLLLAVSLIAIDPHESLSIRSRWWYLLVALAIGLFFMRNGGLKITRENDLENTPILMYGYAFGLGYFAIALALDRYLRRVGQPPKALAHVRGEKFALKIGLVNGLCSYGGIQLYAYALTIGPASLISPIFASNGLVVALLSIGYFHERLSKLQMLALAGIMLGLILLAS